MFSFWFVFARLYSWIKTFRGVHELASLGPPPRHRPIEIGSAPGSTGSLFSLYFYQQPGCKSINYLGYPHLHTKQTTAQHSNQLIINHPLFPYTKRAGKHHGTLITRRNKNHKYIIFNTLKKIARKIARISFFYERPFRPIPHRMILDNAATPKSSQNIIYLIFFLRICKLIGQYTPKQSRYIIFGQHPMIMQGF